MTAVSRVCRVASAGRTKRRLHNSAVRHAITHFQMPAMSPTMTEGGIASWKKKEGQSFSQGDVLLEIETDKATIDVEAQEDGIMGKIITPEGTKNVLVGKIIALLAEEGDDISNLEVPKEDTAPPPKPKPSSAPIAVTQPSQFPDVHLHIFPTHSKPLFPSVSRLLLEHNITNPDKIKGTGVRGMITKGDVLTFLGQTSNPLGTFKYGPSPFEEALQAGQKVPAPSTPPKVPLDGPAIRRLIVSSMLQASQKSVKPTPTIINFDSIISDYLPSSPKALTSSIPPSKPKTSSNYFDGLY